METTHHHWHLDNAKMVLYLCWNHWWLVWYEATKFQPAAPLYGLIRTRLHLMEFLHIPLIYGKKCPRCLIIWLRWARKHQWTLINCICFTTSLFFNFDTLLNSSLSLLSFPTNKGVITWFSFAITWIDNVIMHQQEDKCNSLRNNIAHSGNHCGVIVSQSITVIERCDPNHWSPQQINVLTEAENIAVQSKTSGP